MRDTLSATLGTWAAELGVTRDVLRATLARAGVVAVGGTNQRPVYRARDVFAAVREQPTEAASPHAVLVTIKAEMAMDELRRRRGELVDVVAVRAALTALGRYVAESFDMAPDVLERAAGLTPKQVEQLERFFDERRAEFARRITATHVAQGATDEQIRGRDRTAMRNGESGDAAARDDGLRGSGGAAGTVSSGVR